VSHGIHNVRPHVRMTENPLSKDKVYRRLSSRIRERAASQILRKTAQMAKKRPGMYINDDLEQCSIGRSPSVRLHEDSTKLICRFVDHHPIAWDRARYNRKKTESPSELIRSKLETVASTSGYNDGNIWPSSSTMVSKPSFELFGHMNSQPLHKDVKKGFTNIVSRDERKKTSISNTSSGSQVKSRDRVTRVNMNMELLVSDKENADRQLVGNARPNDFTPRIKGRISVAMNTSASNKRDYSSCKAKPSAKDIALKNIQSRKDRKDEEHTRNNNLALVSKNSQKTQKRYLKSHEKQIPKDHPQMEETKDIFPDKRADQSLPGTDIPTRYGENVDNPTRVVPEACLTVLISKGVYDYTQKANQKAALMMLTDLCISYNIVDGMDPSQREIRNAFFEISGVRGNYPQIFSGKRFLGGYDWLHNSKIEDLVQFARK